MWQGTFFRRRGGKAMVHYFGVHQELQRGIVNSAGSADLLPLLGLHRLPGDRCKEKRASRLYLTFVLWSRVEHSVI